MSCGDDTSVCALAELFDERIWDGDGAVGGNRGLGGGAVKERCKRKKRGEESKRR